MYFIRLRNKNHHAIPLLWWIYFVVSQSPVSGIGSYAGHTETELRNIFRRIHRDITSVYCAPLHILHGSIITEGIYEGQQEFRAGTRLQVKCDARHHLRDPSVRFIECQEGGTWTGQSKESLPVCVGKRQLSEMALSTTHAFAVKTDCDYPLIIRHGIVDTGEGNTASAFLVGHVVVYSCEPGYRLKGTSVYTCTSRRKWSPAYPPICEILPVIPTTAPTTVQPPPRSVNSTIMQVLLYVSIPLLLVLALAIACNIRNRAKAKSIRHRLQESNVEELVANGSHRAPTAPLLDDALSYEQPRPPSGYNTDDDLCLPPSYEEAVQNDRPPSFYTVQRSFVHQ